MTCSMLPELIAFLHEARSNGVRFTIPNGPPGCNNPSAGAYFHDATIDDLIEFQQDRLGFWAARAGVTRNQLVAFTESGFGRNCSALTRKKRPCLNQFIAEISAKEWVERGMVVYCPVHERCGVSDGSDL